VLASAIRIDAGLESHVRTVVVRDDRPRRITEIDRLRDRWIALGLVIDHTALLRLAGLVLIGWAAWHALYGHQRRVRVGMQTGLLGLVLWSFLMASAHGAGLMLIPALAPICGSTPPGGATLGVPLALAALGVHSAAMLAAIAAVSLIVYDWAGVDFLRRGWINVDLIWVAVLATCGVILLIT